MNWALWVSGLKGPQLTILVDRGENAPALSDYELRHKLAAPVKLAPAEQWLAIAVLAKLYPPPAMHDEPASKPAPPKPPGPPEQGGLF